MLGLLLPPPTKLKEVMFLPLCVRNQDNLKSYEWIFTKLAANGHRQNNSLKFDFNFCKVHTSTRARTEIVYIYEEALHMRTLSKIK